MYTVQTDCIRTDRVHAGRVWTGRGGTGRDVQCPDRVSFRRPHPTPTPDIGPYREYDQKLIVVTKNIFPVSNPSV